MLITDRTQYHVDLLNSLRKKSWIEMSASERNLWNTEATKGAYNHTDLNRVETVVGKIAEFRNITMTTKTNWTPWDIPTKADMERYLSNVQVLIDDAEFWKDPFVPEYGLNIPKIPKTMDNLTYQGANQIESALETLCLRYNIDLGGNGAVLGTAVLGRMVLGQS